jgi:hypothetical protein
MAAEPRPQVAAVLERLVFPRQRPALLAWLRQLAGLEGVRWLVPAHYAAPVPIDGAGIGALAEALERRSWAPDQGSWAFLAGIDRALVRSGLVPGGG